MPEACAQGLCLQRVVLDDPGMARKGSTPPPVCRNRKARHDYEILEKIEAGLILRGSEVKALREGKGNLVDAYVSFDDEKPVLLKFEISRYTHDQVGELAPRRPRGLLLKKSEARKLKVRLRERGLTLVPLSVYFSGPWAKVEIGLARGKARKDKRQALKLREAEREMDREAKRRR